MDNLKSKIKVLSYPILSVFLDEIKKHFSEKMHKHTDADITSMSASKLTGNIDIARLPSDVIVTSEERAKWNKSETNQNAFSNVVIDSTTISADTKTDSLILSAGSNVQITPDVTNDKITISATDTKYSHPTTSGNKHIPSGGKAGQVLKWSADGTAVWDNDSNTTYTNMTGANATVAGKSGLVPAPAAGSQVRFLRGDGTWQTPPGSSLSSLGITATATELNYVDGVTSNIQNQINNKATKAHSHTLTQKTEPTTQNNGDIWFIED